jgi:hypothetical protein
VAATPIVRLFEVRHAPGEARVAARARVLPDERAALEAMAMPEAVGLDPAQEVVATDGDVRGAELPAQGRSSRAEIVRRSQARLDVRAQGPGLLVLADSWDAGWSARVDGRPARVLRVNHAELAVALPEGTHRVLLRYRPRAFSLGLVLCALGAAALAAAAWRGGRAV